MGKRVWNSLRMDKFDKGLAEKKLGSQLSQLAHMSMNNSYPTKCIETVDDNRMR